jgi:hypothetical protein
LDDEYKSLVIKSFNSVNKPRLIQVGSYATLVKRLICHNYLFMVLVLVFRFVAKSLEEFIWGKLDLLQ